jgi:RES domain-containing protein
MIVYRIVKHKSRTGDLSGTGAYREGGRWNSAGTYAVYTSENRALAALELLVHLDGSEIPPGMFIMSVNISDDTAIYTVPATEIPGNWRVPGNVALKHLGDQLLIANEYLAIRVPSAVMPYEYNYVLNPLYPGFAGLVKVEHIVEYSLDERLP